MSLIFPEKETVLPLYSESPLLVVLVILRRVLTPPELAYRKLDQLRSLESIHLSWGRNVAARGDTERQSDYETPAWLLGDPE